MEKMRYSTVIYHAACKMLLDGRDENDPAVIKVKLLMEHLESDFEGAGMSKYLEQAQVYGNELAGQKYEKLAASLYGDTQPATSLAAPPPTTKGKAPKHAAAAPASQATRDMEQHMRDIQEEEDELAGSDSEEDDADSFPAAAVDPTSFTYSSQKAFKKLNPTQVKKEKKANQPAKSGKGAQKAKAKSGAGANNAVFVEDEDVVSDEAPVTRSKAKKVVGGSKKLRAIVKEEQDEESDDSSSDDASKMQGLVTAKTGARSASSGFVRGVGMNSGTAVSSSGPGLFGGGLGSTGFGYDGGQGQSEAAPETSSPFHDAFSRTATTTNRKSSGGNGKKRAATNTEASTKKRGRKPNAAR